MIPGHPDAPHNKLLSVHLPDCQCGNCEKCECLGTEPRPHLVSGGRDAKQGDHVNHPKHYTSHPSGIECIEVIEHMTLNIGNAIKYLWRVGLKGDAVEDLEKAIWYIQREIALRKRANLRLVPPPEKP